MNPTLLLATSAASHSHSFLDALPHMAGMAMVMVSLTCLWGVTALCARFLSFVLPAAKAQAQAPRPATPETADTTPDDGIPPRIVAVISAAVATVCQQPVRIISIKDNSSSWEQAGRRSVLTSHRIR